MNRTLCKLILAGALLVTAALPPTSVQAAGTCCQNCLNRYNSCYGTCAPTNTTCQDNCYSSYESCAIGCSRFGQSCPF